jgi:hypothetical protein
MPRRKSINRRNVGRSSKSRRMKGVKRTKRTNRTKRNRMKRNRMKRTKRNRTKRNRKQTRVSTTNAGRRRRDGDRVGGTKGLSPSAIGATAGVVNDILGGIASIPGFIVGLGAEGLDALGDATGFRCEDSSGDVNFRGSNMTWEDLCRKTGEGRGDGINCRHPELSERCRRTCGKCPD